MRFVYSPVGGSEALRGRVTQALQPAAVVHGAANTTHGGPGCSPALQRSRGERLYEPDRRPGTAIDAPSPGTCLEATRPARDRVRHEEAAVGGRLGVALRGGREPFGLIVSGQQGRRSCALVELDRDRAAGG